MARHDTTHEFGGLSVACCLLFVRSPNRHIVCLYYVPYKRSFFCLYYVPYNNAIFLAFQHFFTVFSSFCDLQVGIDPATPVTGPEADVMLAAYYAAEVAAKTIKAGNTNTQV